ncbi:ROK family transcriptional regulator [Companilactobacillus alimentarius]|uniref:Sugar kinase n=1 Tax=Companilactobacillus alimentarius DSM 20249 TaxID=1423720 RepID=A0A2K9HG14_9LACO|nr:ROK family protein [Companilactobacillus alimentarius]AUI71318.1 hypothetical protein LA20249_03505 [Companilactobacillus alimentarius DSM 20249]KRK74789.1 xylose repressor [Companilactobacillus alimentarius DSM 20249]GEO44296.1 transcriptional regulator [Companilactobacillus alimentarius]
MNRLTIRRINELNVLREVFNQTPTSRADVAKNLGLTKSTVYNIFTQLSNDNLVYDIGQGNSTRSGGRKPILTNFNAQAGYTINAKINSTTISCMSNWLDGSIIDRQEFPIEGKEASQQLLALYQAIKLLKLDNNLSGISVAIGGVVKNNRVVNALNHDLANYDLVQILQSRFNVPVLIENESNLAALAIRDFSSRTIKSAAALSLTDRVGVGLIIDGELYSGFNSEAGEIGQAKFLGLGNNLPISLEEVGSDQAVLNQLEKLKNKRVVVADILRWYDLGDEEAMNILKNFQKSLTIILQNILLLFDPEKVVLSSKILRAIPDILVEVKQQLNQIMSHPLDLELADNADNDNLLGGCALITRKILDLPTAELNFKRRIMPLTN